jgi:hypothetical protein
MKKRALHLMGTVVILFFAFISRPSIAFDTMSWSPRTPAGGAFVSDPNFWIRQAEMAKWGSEVFFFPPNKNKNKNKTKTWTTGGSSRYGVFQALDDEGNVILFNADGDPIEKRDDEIVSRDATGNFFYFTPQTSHVTTSQINKARAQKR